MSGFTAVYNLNGAPIAHELLRAMHEAIVHRGPDGNSEWIHNQIGFAHQMMWTTPEARTEQQPLLDATGQLCLVMDGRIDNRAEVKKALAARGYTLRVDHDAEIMLQAYECWGESFPAQIIGDFAVLIWDERKQHLFCARDVFGVKPFYYGINGQTILFSSEIRAFFADPTFPVAINEGMVGEFLVDAITSKEETLYQHLFRLPPAHFMIVDANGIKKQRYWDFDPNKEIRYRSDAEYAEHFLELFTEVVTQHMRSDRPVGAELSGGLDSSSIVCLIRSLIKKGELPENGFETFSLVFPGIKDADESHYIQAVLDKWGGNANLLPPANDPSVYMKSLEHSRYLPSAPNFHMGDSIRALAREKGIRTLLMGIGGDEYLTGTPTHCADLLTQGRLLSLWKQSRAYQQIYYLPYPIFSCGVLPILRPYMSPRLKQFVRSFRQKDRNPFAPLLPEFAKRINLADRIKPLAPRQKFTTYAQQDIYDVADNGWFAYRFELENQDAAMFGIEYRHPLNNRKIAEYCLAIPEAQRWERRNTKRVLRNALQEILPEKIAKRDDKASFSYLFDQVYQAVHEKALSSKLNLDSLSPYLDTDAIKVFFNEAISKNVQPQGITMWRLWMVWAMHLWQKQL